MVKTNDIKTYLDSYGGDVNAAIEALRGYAGEQKALAARPKREITGEVLIAVNDLKKTYRVGRQDISALAGVTLTIHKGEFVALTGSSGSGKSTLLQLIGGLDKPTGGTVVVNGSDLSRLGDHKISEFRNRTIGFVFQFFYLQPFLKLRQNLEVAGMPLRTKAKQRAQHVAELAEVVGLADRLGHYPRELSGGQMQRAAIARALQNNPEILLADEPTGNLDSKTGEIVLGTFQRLNREQGRTIILITHEPDVAEHADRILFIKDGILLEDKKTHKKRVAYHHETN